MNRSVILIYGSLPKNVKKPKTFICNTAQYNDVSRRPRCIFLTDTDAVLRAWRFFARPLLHYALLLRLALLILGKKAIRPLIGDILCTPLADNLTAKTKTFSFDERDHKFSSAK